MHWFAVLLLDTTTPRLTDSPRPQVADKSLSKDLDAILKPLNSLVRTMDDDFGADEDFLAALVSSASAPSRPQPQPPRPRVQQPTPQKVQQPTPQRLDKAPPVNASNNNKVVQPTPQALPQRGSGSAILVSPRQRGNPVLASLKSMPWEYSDIAADYGLGLSTCALFLRFAAQHPMPPPP